MCDTVIWKYLMKDIKGYIIIGLSIIIGSIIISYTIHNNNYTALDLCYKDVYAAEFESEKGSSDTLIEAKAFAAKEAMYECTNQWEPLKDTSDTILHLIK